MLAEIDFRKYKLINLLTCIKLLVPDCVIKGLVTSLKEFYASQIRFLLFFFSFQGEEVAIMGSMMDRKHLKFSLR